MLKRLSLLIAICAWVLPLPAVALDAVPITLLPFEVYTQAPLAHLQKEIPDILGRHLSQEGAQLVPADLAPTELETLTALNVADRRQIAARVGAAHVIWGSLTLVGEQFSLDAQMAAAAGSDPPEVFYTEGDGIETLSAALKQLATDIGAKLFRREKVVRVTVEGNKRIESDAILRIVQTQPGDVYLARSLTQDLKSVYGMGYFEDVRVESETEGDGKVIIFKVTEKPTVRIIRIKGNRVFDDDAIKENLTFKTGAVLNLVNIQRNLERIEELYKDKNYHNVKVTFSVTPTGNNQADVEFTVEEGEKVRVRKIVLEGNEAYSARELKKLMKTKEEGFFSWITSSGELNMEDLNQDASLLTAFYQNSGYIQARVADPQVSFEENWIEVAIKIDEGPRFKVGKVGFSGDLVRPESELLESVKITDEVYYSREVLRNDVLVLTDLYSDEGFAYADIAPRIDRDPENQVVNIDFVINQGQPVYFEKIIIGGNTKTRDKVIRRQLKVYEQELYSGAELKRSVRNLKRLDYFDDVKVDTLPGSAEDQMVLKIDVTEKPTGTFSFGGGYSTAESLFAVAQISQRNLFGRGQVLQLAAHLGGKSTRYQLSFTEPWLFDIPLSATGNIFKWDVDYNDYDKESIGFGFRFGYPVFDYTRAFLGYRFELADITDIDEDAARSIKQLEGENITSSLTATLEYDSRDRFFLPTEGQKHSLEVEYAGGPLAGDIAFTKVTAEAGIYIPLFWETTGFARAQAGYVTEGTNGILPDYERFYLGGLNTLRGFDWRDISIQDSNGDDIGGTSMLLFNLEYIVPLIKEAGLAGVVFYDTGNVYGEDQDFDITDLRQSAGAGIRWNSPMGPIRLEYGYVLDPEDDEGGGKWEFGMGGAF
ncbi:MAG TPA: outer membrane protein assembly factor BamA [Desulfobacterales bacterium]|jgi:outer membrane protein insertion porin family|nr:outer membrane protein assembly factor BamA [Desulfobacterales bacterium]